MHSSSPGLKKHSHILFFFEKEITMTGGASHSSLAESKEKKTERTNRRINEWRRRGGVVVVAVGSTTTYNNTSQRKRETRLKVFSSPFCLSVCVCVITSKKKKPKNPEGCTPVLDAANNHLHINHRLYYTSAVPRLFPLRILTWAG